MARAFTLVELLVVVTIIVILLALLMPALDKAVYQAQLAHYVDACQAPCGGVSFGSDLRVGTADELKVICHGEPGAKSHT